MINDWGLDVFVDDVDEFVFSFGRGDGEGVVVVVGVMGNGDGVVFGYFRFL